MTAYVERCEGEAGGHGPLAGWTFAVKDLIAVRGLPLRAGSRARADASPEPADAPIVGELRRAGAALVGTTTLHELALGVTGVNRHAGTPAHPVDADRIPGGSSSGSAVAVAEGSARLALGTDTGGSVRIPAALCGVVGFKPERGRWPMEGVLPLAPTLDHLGLFARTVDDVVQAYAALDGGEVVAARAPATVGVVRDQTARAEPAVARAVEAAVAALRRGGAQIVEVDWPSAEQVRDASTVVLLAEAAAVHKRTLRERPDALGDDVRKRLETGRDLPLATRRHATSVCRRVEAQARTELARVDCVVGPTVGVVAPPLADAERADLPPRLVAETRLANVAGLPAVSIPLPGTALPVGLQVMARDDRHTLAAAAAIADLLGVT